MGAHLVRNLLEAAFTHWVTVIAVVLAVWLLRNRFYNDLNKYPGPFVASLTDWWRFLDVYKSRPELTHQALHAKYGDVVRLGPNTLSFADPAALKSIYGLNKGFTKVSIYHFQPCTYFLQENEAYKGPSPSFTRSNRLLSRAAVSHPFLAPRTTTSTPNFAAA